MLAGGICQREVFTISSKEAPLLVLILGLLIRIASQYYKDGQRRASVHKSTLP